MLSIISGHPLCSRDNKIKDSRIFLHDVIEIIKKRQTKSTEKDLNKHLMLPSLKEEGQKVYY